MLHWERMPRPNFKLVGGQTLEKIVIKYWHAEITPGDAISKNQGEGQRLCPSPALWGFDICYLPLCLPFSTQAIHPDCLIPGAQSHNAVLNASKYKYRSAGGYSYNHTKHHRHDHETVLTMSKIFWQWGFFSQMIFDSERSVYTEVRRKGA